MAPTDLFGLTGQVAVVIRVGRYPKVADGQECGAPGRLEYT
jgi:hypothetical protein